MRSIFLFFALLALPGYLVSHDNKQAGNTAIGCIIGSGIGFGMTYALVVALRAATGM